jgi:ribosomal protein L31E
MRRTHIYVVHSGDRWAVKLEGFNIVQQFNRKAQALRAANEVAEEIWSQEGVPTRVQVQVSRGRWDDVRGFGDEPLPLAS